MTRSWQTKLIHSETSVPDGYRSLVTPVFRGSTTVFPRANALTDTWKQHEVGYTYGLYGTPTTMELAARIAELEGGYRTFIAPGGQSALALINLAFLDTGDRGADPRQRVQSAPSAGRRSAAADGGRMRLLRIRRSARASTRCSTDRTRLVWCESPGSITMEVQDVPAIADAAHRVDAKVAIDNTYSAGVYFDAFAHGVDIVDAGAHQIRRWAQRHPARLRHRADKADYERIGSDDAGVRDVRVARRVQPGAARDADTGRSSRASGALDARGGEAGSRSVPRSRACCIPRCRPVPGTSCGGAISPGRRACSRWSSSHRTVARGCTRFVDALQLFEIGWSWGGVTSLAVPVNPPRSVAGRRAGVLVRFNIGLEAPSDLLADLEGALPQLQS